MPTRTLREAASQVGSSVRWLRSQIKAGTVAGELGPGKHGPTYTLTDDAVEQARALYLFGTRQTATAARGELVGLATETRALAEQVATLTVSLTDARVEAARAQALAEERATELDTLRADLANAQTRIEALKGLGVWDRLLGRHKAV